MLRDLRRDYDGSTALVTGAGGFIGSHLVEQLLEHGARVRALDLAEPAAGDNLEPVRHRIEYTRGSVTAGTDLAGLMRGSDYVFHLAGNASVPLSAEDPALDFDSNVVGTFRVIQAFRAAGAGRLVFASSASVYGEPVSAPMDEEHPLRPQSPYAGHKLAAEFLLDAHARCFGFDQRRVRLFSTFGPRQRKYVMFDLLEKLRRDPARLEVLGTGEQVRTYSFVTDTVLAFMLVAAHPDARGRVYNVGGERRITIRELVELLIAGAGIARPQIAFTGQSWAGDVIHLYGDSSRLFALGYRPRHGLEEGIKQLVAWFRREYAPPW